MTALAGWETFFEIVGTSAGALIGLQFVALALVAERRNGRIDLHGGAAFATPSVVQFGAVLLLSATLSAPWESVLPVAVLLGAGGLAGMGYCCTIAWHLRRQNGYEAVFSDWLFHVLLPLAAWAGLAATGLVLRTSPREALFGVATAALVLLFSGIHNIWDVVTFHMFVRK